MATGDITKRFSHGAGAYEVELIAVADTSTVEVQLPKNASKPIMAVYDDAANANALGYIAAVGHNGKWDPDTKIFTYTNNTSGAFTGKLVLNFVAG